MKIVIKYSNVILTLSICNPRSDLWTVCTALTRGNMTPEGIRTQRSESWGTRAGHSDSGATSPARSDAFMKRAKRFRAIVYAESHPLLIRLRSVCHVA